jgi:hypothetical protein
MGGKPAPLDDPQVYQRRYLRGAHLVLGATWCFPETRDKRTLCYNKTGCRLWPRTTELCSGDERGEKSVDQAVGGELRSE